MKIIHKLFLGHSPDWYKNVIIGFLLINPVVLLLAGSTFTGWVILIEFIFTLAMALKCYPLLPGGLLAIETVVLKMTDAESVYHEVVLNFPVILLLIFMVAGIYFLKDMLAFVFIKILLSVKNKIALSVVFLFAGAFLSAWLDALTVMAVMIAVMVSFVNIYEGVSIKVRVPDISNDSEQKSIAREDLNTFEGFLRNVLMHGAIGTALGGVTTLVGEPQNLLIAKLMKWEFWQFFGIMAPVTMPVLVIGIITCIVVEKFNWFDFKYLLPDRVRVVLTDHDKKETEKRNELENAKLIAQAVVAVILIIGLATHVAEVGIIGLVVIILSTTFTGKSDEHQIGSAFTEALPFTALLVVFFGIVSMIEHTKMFEPIIHWALSLKDQQQLLAFFTASGVLSMISDNVFVATIYIQEAVSAFESGLVSQTQLDKLAMAINTGTNIPSIATPNGQAAFLFLLTSSVAGLIKLSYVRMMIMAFPYTITMTAVAVYFVSIYK